MKKIRIAFDANPLTNNKTGVGYLTNNLVSVLAKDYRDEIELIGFYRNFLGKNSNDTLPKGPNISYKQSKLIPTKFLNILKRFGIQIPTDLLFVINADIYLFTDFVSSPVLSKKPKIVFIHDLSFIDVPEYVSSKNCSYLKKWVLHSIIKSDSIITISDFTKSRIIENYATAKNIEIIPLPPSPKAKPDNSILKRLGVDNAPYVLFLGTIEPRKNIQNLLDAFEMIYQNTGVSLILAGGKGWNDSDIIKKINYLKNKNIPIITTGYVTEEEKSSLYKNAELYIQPSHYEGFGMPILEAMSHGCAVSCSDIVVFKEVAGNAAIYFDQESVTDMITTLSDLINDKKTLKKLRDKSTVRVNEYPNWSDSAEITFNTIVDVLKNKKPKV